MEFASYLAGERWSDHPGCTHPLLAQLARCVNDCIGDDFRGSLVPYIPSVIGLTGDDPRIDVELALHAATTALPVAPHSRQGVIAIGILSGERILAVLDGRPEDDVRPESREALRNAPEAARWARQFGAPAKVSVRNFCRNAAPCIVQVSVEGIAEACIARPEQMLLDLLDDSIVRCRQMCGAPDEPARTVRRVPGMPTADEASLPAPVPGPARAAD
ncbi:MAG TPA: hypothetical protein VFJ12_15665 [Segeticoccus sp.]|nr:hypothetical protein [Segeticoccus sp.]